MKSNSNRLPDGLGNPAVLSSQRFRKDNPSWQGIRPANPAIPELPPELALTNAVIILACRDYAEALLELKTDPENREYREQAEECEEFFRSDNFAGWTSISPDYLMKRLQEHPEHVKLWGEKIRRRKNCCEKWSPPGRLTTAKSGSPRCVNF